MFTDAAALVIALIASIVAARPANDRRTFGYQRAEVFGALVNGVILIVLSVWVAVEGISAADRTRARSRSPAGSCCVVASSASSPTRVAMWLLERGAAAQHQRARRVPRGARRPPRLGGRHRRGDRHPHDRVDAGRRDRVAPHRGDDRAARDGAAARGRLGARRVGARRACRCTRSASTSSPRPESSTCTTCTSGSSPAARRCSPPTSSSTTTRSATVGSGEILSELQGCLAAPLRRRALDVPARARGPRRARRARLSAAAPRCRDGPLTGHRILAHDLVGALVGPQSPPARMPQDAAGRELAELHLADELRPHPQRIAGVERGHPDERVLVGAQRQSASSERREGRVAEARADAPRVAAARPAPGCRAAATRTCRVRPPLPGRMPADHDLLRAA